MGVIFSCGITPDSFYKVICVLFFSRGKFREEYNIENVKFTLTQKFPRLQYSRTKVHQFCDSPFLYITYYIQIVYICVLKVLFYYLKLHLLYIIDKNIPFEALKKIMFN